MSVALRAVGILRLLTLCACARVLSLRRSATELEEKLFDARCNVDECVAEVSASGTGSRRHGDGSTLHTSRAPLDTLLLAATCSGYST